MVTSSVEVTTQPARRICYPESDGQPMAENTLQFRWIVLIKENLETLFQAREDVFVAGDLLWYPVEGHPEICRAPDALVVFGRPKGYRGSYRQWEEAGIAPQVVFEIYSPSNTFKEMLDKLEFYERHGVDEYYTYDPEQDRNDLTGFRREGERLRPIEPMDGWVSPRLGIRFDMAGGALRIFRPDGTPFRSHQEQEERIVQTEQEREAERLARQQAEQERQQAEQEREAERLARQQVEQEREAERLARQQAEQQVAALAAKLRALGIDPG